VIAAAIAANLAVVRQGVAWLRSPAARDHQRCAPAVFNSTSGGHLRHVIEHYTALLDGLEAGIVDYERRARDAQMEADATAAARALELIGVRLENLREADDRPLRVRAETTGDEVPPVWCTSSLQRELEFLLSHTVHHYALVATIGRLQGHEPGAEFGMAPSTLKFRRAEASACAP
jgi:uncharacterized damage-inducible protein DinB